MRADNSHHLAAAARQRHEQTMAKAHEAMRHLEASGAAVTIAAIAAKAGVSRAWLYAEPDLRNRLNALRNNRLVTPPAPVQPSSDASLRARLTLAHQRIRELADDNQQLRAQIARLHGQLRTARLNGSVADTVHDTNSQVTHSRSSS